jgi:putative ABC transport system permease protein
MRILRRLAYWLRFGSNNDDLREELEFHRAQHERDAIARGESPADARDSARRAMGNETYMREESRAVWLHPRLEALAGDLSYAVRGLKRNPLFAAGIIITLALGIGANAAMFSIIDRLLLRPPAFMPGAASVSRIHIYRTARDVERTRALPYALYTDVARWAKDFPQVASFSRLNMGVSLGGVTRPIDVAAVSGGFFRFFDAPPQLGSYFSDADDVAPQGRPVVVLSGAAWKNHFGGRHDVLGETMHIGNVTYTIVGVAPDAFNGVWPYRSPLAFIPVTSYGGQEGEPGWEKNYGWAFSLEMMIRRPPGMTEAQASALLSAEYRRRYQEQFDENPRMPAPTVAKPRILAAPILAARGPTPSSVARIATWIGGVTIIILLIACANVASLLLSRMVRRRREVAVRLALGAGRGRLVSQLVTEGMLIATVGGIAGVLVAVWGSSVLHAMFLPGVERVPVLSDPRTLALAGIMVLGTGLLTGLMQVAQAGRANLTDDLRSGARDGKYRRIPLRTVLLTVQCALSAVLLVGAGLFVRSLNNVRNVPLGFDANPVLLVELENMNTANLDSAATAALRLRLLAAAKRTPGVTHATLQESAPFGGSSSRPISVDGIDSTAALGDFYFNTVSADYFATMGTRILRGRGIEDRDGEGAERVIVIGESMGKALWPGQDPIGRCVRMAAPSANAPCTTVVGIAEDIRAASFEPEPRTFYYYRPAAQWYPQDGGLFVRVKGDAGQLVESLRKQLQGEMPGASYLTVSRLSDLLDARMRSWALGARVFTAFGALALLLSAIGLYSAIAYNVAQRRREIGVRLALGAERGRVVSLMVREGLRFAIPGVAIGCAIALYAGRWVKPLLFSESPYSPAVYGSVIVALIAVAAVASWVPALKAGRLDPKEALQAE